MLPLDVVWIRDELVDPPHWKMAVCVDPADGLFLRINTRSRIRPCVALAREPDHHFLDHDSYIECNLIEVDDYLIEEARIVGSVSSALVPILIETLQRNRSMSPRDRDRSVAALQLLRP